MKSIVTEDGSLTAFSEQFQQTYHSQYGALREAIQVYLNNSGVSDRLCVGNSTRVLEIGFGLGLNFLVTAARAKKYQASLEYTGIENALISPVDYQKLQYDQIEGLADTSDFLYQSLTKIQPGGNAIEEIHHSVTLKVIQDHAQSLDYENHYFHAVYLDAFSPDVNPELWTEVFFSKLYASLTAGGILATYCVKGAIRRSLENVGFELEKKIGPKGKREVLIAIRA